MKALVHGALLLAVTATACKSRKPLPIIGGDIPARSTEKILERALAHERPDTFRYYSARAQVQVDLPEGSRSFKAVVRMTADSAVWVSVVPLLGIEMARILVTPDSLHILDKLGDRYFRGDTAQARAKFGFNPGLDLLQQALLGRAIGLDAESRYRNDREDGRYVLTTKAKRRFVKAADEVAPADSAARDQGMNERRLERTLRQAEEQEAVVMRYWFEPDHFRVMRVQLADLAHDRTADVRYEERAGAEMHHLPTRIHISVSGPGRQASGTLELSRIEREGPLPMNFRVPEKFTPMP
ncbi:MAG: DUF4292 domain-containing protein [Flavobacteriales bacterium]|jgi:hypothetical protein|nr:DUF4292 domain-containing protein [Flavobacteriales bacterium]